MRRPTVASHTGSRRGRLTVLVVLAVGAAAAVAKIIEEVRVKAYVEARLAAIREELRAADPAPLLANEHRGLREWLEAKKVYPECIQYRDRAIPLLEEDLRLERDPPGSVGRAAWILILLKINSSRSREFFEETLPRIPEPDLKREAERLVKRWGRPGG